MRAVRKPVLLAAALALFGVASGCHPHSPHNQYLARSDSITLGLGNAPAANQAVQTIDPWPPYAGDRRWATDGRRMELAVDRYSRNESIEPEGLTTTPSFGAGGQGTP